MSWAGDYLEQKHADGPVLADITGVSRYKHDPLFQDILSGSVRNRLRRTERGLAYYDRKLRTSSKCRLREKFVFMLRSLHPKSVQLHCLEWSPRIYRSSIEHLPGSYWGLRSNRTWDLQTSNIDLYRCCAFEDFEPPKGKHSGESGYEAAWLDFTGPLTKTRLDRLRLLWSSHRMKLLSVTFMNGRGIANPIEALKEVLPRVGFFDVEQYSDSRAPMVQVFLWKGDPPKRLQARLRGADRASEE